MYGVYKLGLDPDLDLGWFRIPQSLDLDPDTESVNLDPKHLSKWWRLPFEMLCTVQG
jgi:hypothetical protein